MPTLLKKTLPWLICAAIFYYIFTKIPPSEVLATMRFVDISKFILYALFYFLFVHILDCATMQHFISRFAAPITHRESWIARGVSYLIMIINYHAAQGALAVYFKKTHNAPLAKTLGTLVFVNFVDFFLVLTCAFIAVLAGAEDSQNFSAIKGLILKLAPVFYLSTMGWLLFWKNSERGFIARLERFRPLRWVLHHDVFHIFRYSTAKDYLAALLYRSPIVVGSIAVFNATLSAFDVHIAWQTLFLYNPLVLLVWTLPITPSGLGASQLLAVELFAPHLTGTIIDAGTFSAASIIFSASLTWAAANQVIKAMFGMVSMAFTSKELFKNEQV